MALKIPGITIPCGQPLTQYPQFVQGMLGRLRISSAAFSRSALSSFVRDLPLSAVFRLSSICARSDMPLSTVRTPGRPSANRSAQDA